MKKSDTKEKGKNKMLCICVFVFIMFLWIMPLFTQYTIGVYSQSI